MLSSSKYTSDWCTSSIQWLSLAAEQVEEIALYMTVLKRWDGSRIWYPNSMINVVPIHVGVLQRGSGRLSHCTGGLRHGSAALASSIATKMRYLHTH